MKYFILFTRQERNITDYIKHYKKFNIIGGNIVIQNNNMFGIFYDRYTCIDYDPAHHRGCSVLRNSIKILDSKEYNVKVRLMDNIIINALKFES